ncbi:MAG: putative manganese transporter [Sedimentisphaerales bacterium]
MEFLTEALIDTLKLLPLLVVIYFLVSFLEYRYGERMESVLTRFGIFNPVIGALFGCIPQCGFSVVGSALYVKRLISIGTLLAVFLSTSDEAVPVLLSMPGKAHMVWTLIAIKAGIAIVAGIGVDLLLRHLPAEKPAEPIDADNHSDDAKGHSGCCSHHLDEKHSKIEALVYHPLLHTIKIFIYLFVLSVILNLIVQKIGEKRIAQILLGGTVFQPFLASLIGLIPNCFASVLLAKLFADGAISFGSLVAGLSAAGGLGLLVLIKENKSFKNTLFVIGLLVAISVLAGIIIQTI